MSLRRILVLGACILVAGAIVIALVVGGTWHRAGHGTWNREAIQTTFERVVCAHNDASFIYVLENRTASDYRINDESEVKILGRSRSTGDLISEPSKHVSGEFPLLVPAKRRTHFALVWTADHDIDPDHIDDFVKTLNIRSFVLLDKARRYEIEFPGGG